MASPLLLVVFNVSLFLTLVFSTDSPTLQLSVYPNTGVSTANIEVRCQIPPSSSTSSLTSSKFNNVYLTVQTDGVKPSGILVMFDDSRDECRVNRERDVALDVCNSSLILIHVNHTVLNETVRKIEYTCTRGGVTAIKAYEIRGNRQSFVLMKHREEHKFHQGGLSARYYDPAYGNSSSLLAPTTFCLFVVFLIITAIQWS